MTVNTYINASIEKSYIIFSFLLKFSADNCRQNTSGIQRFKADILNECT